MKADVEIPQKKWFSQHPNDALIYFLKKYSTQAVQSFEEFCKLAIKVQEKGYKIKNPSCSDPELFAIEEREAFRYQLT